MKYAERQKEIWKLQKDESLRYANNDPIVAPRGGSREILDKDGNRIGANGVEGGLLKILGVDAADKNAVNLVRQMMAEAGLEHSDGSDPDEWQWRGKIGGIDYTGGNMGKTIGFDLMVNSKYGYNYGNSIVTAVFMNGFDKLSDMILAENNILSKVDTTYADRLRSLVDAKSYFYSQLQALVGGETEITGKYKGQIFIQKDGKDTDVVDTSYYKNYENQHFGLDLGTNLRNDPVFAGISGTVIASGLNNDAGYGRHAVIEYGYQFEGYTYNTGIMGEYAHMADPFTPLEVGQFVTAQTQLGLVGNTGKSAGVHLHYSVYTAPGRSFSKNVMSNIFGPGYAETAMANKPPNNAPSTKTVYDPTAFYNKYKYKY
jgi:murein DD-endopeptidase MepM/ murein hydrolase activator NlpD